MSAGLDILRQLLAGNQRFAYGWAVMHSPEERRRALAGGQAPRAVVLGCSDSRVPAEIIFDHGLGELFVIRVAGNIVAPSQVASVEFAVERFRVPLVVILGHTNCGAIRATLDECLAEDGRCGALDSLERVRHSIVDRIRPVVEPLLSATPRPDRATLEREACRANVRASVRAVRGGSRLLASLADAGRLLIVGAEYSLETGLVEVFEGS